MNKLRANTFQQRALSVAIALTMSTAAVGIAHAADAATSATGGNIPSADRTFVEKAAIGGMTEIEASKLAETKGSSAQVKEYGATMIKDHTKAAGELKTVATSKGVSVPTSLDSSHQRSVDKLAKLSGPDFDKAYIKQMVSDHKTTVSDFQKEAKSGKDSDLQAFAGKTLPDLQGHLKDAQSLNDNMK